MARGGPAVSPASLPPGVFEKKAEKVRRAFHARRLEGPGEKDQAHAAGDRADHGLPRGQELHHRSDQRHDSADLHFQSFMFSFHLLIIKLHIKSDGMKKSMHQAVRV